MQLLLGAEQFRPVLATAQYRAFHLETRDEYLAETEHESLTAFRADESIDPGGPWFDGWLQQVRSARDRGVAIERARIVSVPHTFYTRYLLALTRHNVAAGEDVRYLRREDADPADAVAEDFWLLDERLVAYSLFDERGYWVGAAASTDPVLVAAAVAIRDRIWAQSVPYGEYLVAR
ncbi:hypothetical protein FOH10_21110 [Nocardia otitidiscaviarum]|uniref:DUF6879 domain-containing protein n=1 Tax=Nocardia otitidiscaviarum TaxID=1823 RepID=A0A516NPK2_9NOCA|nr:DUF6879 family protein [Nocardia otitidiscaviarum]MCP9623873.1 hypothetical protein [Nocardia otitidiscaviarum]QDP80836.1 hypothetical protein FOH10_21110 [Nocardia otitidiscaviarum]